MPSPNGYLQTVTFNPLDRTWTRVHITYDADNPPWAAGQLGNYTFDINVGPVGGPYAPATTTGVTECSASPGNPITPNGATETLVGVGGPPGTAGALTPGTAYELEVVVRGPSSTTEVDRWAVPFTTDPYPTTFTPFTDNITQTTADVHLGNVGQTVVIGGVCDRDQVIWDWSTTPGGPYTSTPIADVSGPSPGTTLTGLPAGTQIFWRARLFDDAGTLYYTSPEASFTTAAAADLNPQCATLANPDLITSTSAMVSGSADGVPTDHSLRLTLATVSGGPYTVQASPGVPGTNTPGQSVVHTFTGLAPATTYFFRLEVRGPDGVTVVDASTECTFTTDAASLPPFNPGACPPGGEGAAGNDVEQTVLCDLDAEGNLLGTALAVYEYDPTGTPVGAPTFVDPATGAAYVPQGTLQPCPDAACLPPMQFCQTGTTTGPVEHPGRQYDITLPINPGFAVDSLQIDAVNHPAGITWSIFDVDGDDFAADLQSFIQGRVPAGATVTVTNPNSGAAEICGEALPMTVHIECVRLDQSPPNLIELVYNGGQDLIQNPAYNTTPPTDLSQFQFYYLQRQDAGGTINCTSVANRGWETNDLGGNATRDFEIWGTGPSGLAAIQNTTPTPRGTPVQEVTADINDTGAGPTIWQTFNVTTPGNFRVQLVHGARDPGEQHTIRLSTGDTNDTGGGDVLNNVTTPASVTSSGGPNPWTVLDQTVPLNSGLYTFSFQTTNPVGPNRGGLFTDMRVYVDRPGLRATAVNNDDTCVVTTEETTTNTVCSFWQPQCVGGAVAGWQNVTTGESLTNAEFWAQVPTPGCCLPETEAGEGGGSALSNMLASDIVCVTIGGIRSQAVRYIVTDPSGGVVQEQFIGANGAPVSPDSWTAGDCTAERFVNDVILCDYGNLTGPDGAPVTFLRKYVQSINETGQGQINNFRDFLPDASATYTPVGPVGDCARTADPVATTGLCLPGGVPIAVVTRRTAAGAIVQDGWVNLTTGAFTAGNPPVGTIACGDSSSIQVSGTFCSVETATGNVLALILIEYTYNPDGTIASVRLVNAVDGTTYVVPAGAEITTCPTGTAGPESDLEIVCDLVAGVPNPILADYRRDDTGAIVSVSYYTLAGAPTSPVGTVVYCGTLDTEPATLCDVQANGTVVPFRRRYTFNATTGLQVGTNDTTLDGSTPYAVTGTVSDCAARDTETLVLCDSAVTPNRFIRTYRYGSDGSVVGFTDETLAGAPFVPMGAVNVCATTVQTDTDFVEEVLCDSNGTAFIRLFRFNSVTGALVSTTNTTLAGAAFAPVGAVGLCSDCCPVVVAEGCTNTGSGRYVAIRATNGTVTLTDAITGAAITQANIVACPGDDNVVTLTAQGRLIGDADAAWTPGADVVGTLTSVTLTVLSGTATVTDSNGTVMAGLPAGYAATWTAEDNNQLQGPTSIDAIGGQTAVVWTQR